MKHRILMTALTAGLVGIASAHAKPMHDSDKLFDALDADGNSSLSQQELSNMRQAMAKLRFDTARMPGAFASSKSGPRGSANPCWADFW